MKSSHSLSPCLWPSTLPSPWVCRINPYFSCYEEDLSSTSCRSSIICWNPRKTPVLCHLCAPPVDTPAGLTLKVLLLPKATFLTSSFQGHKFGLKFLFRIRNWIRTEEAMHLRVSISNMNTNSTSQGWVTVCVYVCVCRYVSRYCSTRTTSLMVVQSMLSSNGQTQFIISEEPEMKVVWQLKVKVKQSMCVVVYNQCRRA
jgi:hypothetical protein